MTRRVNNIVLAVAKPLCIPSLIHLLKVRFVDFGNTVVVSLHKLRRLFPRVSQYSASNRC